MITKLIHTAVKSLSSFFFPVRCFSCKVPDTVFCNSCTTHIFSPSRMRFRHVSLAITAFPYRAPAIRSAIRAMKYYSARIVADRFANILADMPNEFFAFEREDNIICMPIPTAASTLRRRGYNQAAYLASIIANRNNIIYRDDILHKTSHTKSQTAFRTTRERKQNIRNAFALSAKSQDAIRGKTVLLIDDVITSGATVNEAARILKNAGAKRVFALAIAFR